jgi:AcrR family transcriptional regulator
VKTKLRLKATERRIRILSAAAEAFASKGYRATSVSEICKSAGITKPVFYDHFESKLAVFIKVAETTRDELILNTGNVMRSQLSFNQRVREIVESFFTFVEEKPTFAKVLLFGAKGEPDLVAIDWKIQQEATLRLVSLLGGEIKRRTDTPKRDQILYLQAEFLKRGMNGLAEWWYHNPSTGRKVLVDTVMDLVWPGIKIQFSRDARER